MDEVSIIIARYNNLKRIQKEYYERKKDEILEKKRETYKLKNPNPNGRGRPRKIMV